MKKKLFLLLAFVVLGVLQAAIFMFAYSDRFEPYSFAQCLLALIYCVPQSLMVSAWVMLPAFLMGFIYVWIRGDWHRRFMIWYVTLVFMPLLLLCCVDWILYGFWGFRLDTTPFIYVLDDPLEAAKQSPWWSFPVSFAMVGALGWLLYRIMLLIYPRRRSGSITRMNTGAAQQREGLWNLLLTIAMWIIGDGCFGLMGIGSAYHTDQQPLNHAATNPVYSFFHSMEHQDLEFEQQYRYMTEEDRSAAIDELTLLASEHADAVRHDSLMGPLTALHQDSLATIVRPGTNVLIVLLESFSGPACQYLNPEADECVMPCVSKAMAEGVAFTQCYANSFRTERGIVSVLSAFPGQPTNSIMTDHECVEHLPFLTHAFADAGYSLEFIHGGDGKFCGLKHYLETAGFERITDRDNYPSEQYDSPWGMHDAFMYDFTYERLKEECALAHDTAAEYPARPYLKVLPTLSSHEPFEVPMQRLEDSYLNSVAYADSCLGDFLDKLRADTLIWNNLLIVGMPDHCYANYPEGVQQHDPERYRIPMFWTGGAVRSHIDVNTICQQTDFAATLLNCYHLQPRQELSYSHDVFNLEAPHFAFYAWPDGFGMLTDSCRYIQDNYYDGHPLPGSNDPTGRAQRIGKAYLQTIYDDMASMKTGK